MSQEKKFANLLEILQTITKSAEDPSTSHPVGSAEDGTSPATEGAHSSENISELKAGLGAVSVPSAPNNPVEPEKLDMGTSVTGSGEAPPEGTPQNKPKDSEISPTDPEKIASISDLRKLAADLNIGLKNLLGDKAKPKVESTSVTETSVPATTSTTPKVAASNEITEQQKQIALTMIKAANETAEKVLTYLVYFKKSADEAAAEDPAAAGMPPGGAGEIAGGGDPKAQALALIVQIMQEAGITPEELLSVLGGAASQPTPAAPAEAAEAVEAPAPEMTVSASEKYSLNEIKRAFDLVTNLKSGLVKA